jgi:CSLREA domain-containing protein/uncharacterized repeat protein (TIGR01451 family)
MSAIRQSRKRPERMTLAAVAVLAIAALAFGQASASPAGTQRMLRPHAVASPPKVPRWSSFAPTSPDATFVVNNSGDGGDGSPGDGVCETTHLGGVCTLRAAIQEANVFAGADTIAFAIGFGAATISPTSALPAVTGALTIDGTTQPGYRGLPVVQLSGASAGAGVDGLTLNATTTVRGLVVNQFGGTGIVAGRASVIQNCFIGTDVTGTLDRGNAGPGIESFGSETIGGPAVGGPLFGPGNLISGNGGAGISIDVANGAVGSTIEGNLIGTNLRATARIGNGGAGISATATGPTHFAGFFGKPGLGNVIAGNAGDGISLLNSANAVIDANKIGTDSTTTVNLGNTGNGVLIADNASSNVGANSENTIYFNTGAGIKVTTSSTSNFVAKNETFFNGGLGIDLGTTGVTANDPGDADTGPNSLQNFPVLSSPSLSADGRSVTFTAKLNSTPNARFELDYYTGPSCDTSGNGEGTDVAGTSVDVQTDGSGNLTLTKTVFADPGEVVTATASRRLGNPVFSAGTSEFSACIAVPFAHTFTVNSAGDASDANPGNGKCLTAGVVCTLRAAIQEANALAGRDLVKFAIGTGAQNIVPGSAVPSITQPVTIDGSTQPGFTSVPLISLDGGGAGAGVDGLTIAGDRVTIKSLRVNRFSRDGIRIASGLDATIQGCEIGTNAGASSAQPNGGNGITVMGGFRAQIGGTLASKGNFISGNAGNGILISALLAHVERNMIGTNHPGTSDLGNGGDGVKITVPLQAVVGGSAPTFRNVISGNNSNGVEILGNGSSTSFSNTVVGNFIGVGADGSTKIGNSHDGVRIGPGATNSNVGSTGAAQGNVISGNGGDGVAVAGLGTTGTRVRGNLIGTDQAGSADVGNTGSGVSISGAPGVVVGAAPAPQRNVISGNGGHGVLISGSGAAGASVVGNTVGLGATGTGALPNDGDGLFVQSGSAVVGAAAVGGGNVIAANRGSGVSLATSAASGATLLANLIGIDVNSASGVGNAGDGVVIAGAPNATVGGTASGARNVVSGNALDGIAVSGAGATGTKILGNLVGTSGSGLAAVGNGGAGIRVRTSGATIGGGMAGQGNVISGNTGDGVVLVGAGATGNTVAGNLIGVKSTAGIVHGSFQGLGNGGDGVLVSAAANNEIGSDQGANVIGANGHNGVELAGSAATTNAVAGNRIGTSGIDDLGNTLDGVLVSGPSNTIGTQSGQNVVSGNGQNGIEISGANGNTLLNNLVGVDAAGTSAIANALDGILVNASANTAIGNPVSPPNVVGGNTLDGIVLSGAGTTGTEIFNNIVGDAPGGTGSPNSGNGIRVRNGASDNTIGATATQDGPRANVIRLNGARGVLVEDSTSLRNTIQANSIDANGALGIDLAPVGVTANDNQDADSGPNRLQNFPVLTSAVTGGGFVSLNGSINSTPNTVFTIDVYASPTCDGSLNGEGAAFVGTATLPATGGGGTRAFAALDIPGNVAPNQAITLTATDPNGNTSEFSPCVVAPEALANVSAALVDSPDPVVHGNNLTYTVTVANAGPNRALGTSLTQTLGQRLTFVSATPTVGTCDQVGTRVICDLGTLASGQSATVTIVATVSASFTGTIQNTATATSDVTDPTLANNTSTQTTTVT